jgi:16S rRNA (cytidine1402-2'-O)-methyltransferase
LEAPAHAAGVSSPDPGTSESVAAKIARLQSESGIDEKEALKRLARELGQSKSEIYRELQRTRARRS